MEIILFTVSGINMIYYAVLMIFCDTAWMTQLYWPVSACIFILAGWILKIDRKRRRKKLSFLPIEVRTGICVSFGLYFFLAAGVALFILFNSFSVERAEGADYLLLSGNSSEIYDLSENEYSSLACIEDYLEEYDNTKVILVGRNRFVIQEDNTDRHDLMEEYLIEQGIDEERIIKEKGSDNLRLNLHYGYLYIMLKWDYRENHSKLIEPEISIVADRLSVLRYQMILEREGWDMGIVPYWGDPLTIPARLVSEIRLLLETYLANQFG